MYFTKNIFNLYHTEQELPTEKLELDLASTVTMAFFRIYINF